MKLLEIKPVYVDSMPDQFESGVVCISKEFGCAIHLCAGGCGQKTVMGLKPFWNNGWNLVENEDSAVSFNPSIGNFNGENPYHAHYFITNNKIIWC